MTDWQPIETAPRDGTVVLAYDPNWYRYPHPMEYRDGAWSLWFHDVGAMRPTHWMPLPEPPGEGEA